MFLKEPELNFSQLGNNGNVPQGQYQSNTWMNTEVHAFPIPRGDNYERFIDNRDSNTTISENLRQNNDVEMRPERRDITDISGDESLFLTYRDSNIALGNNTHHSISEHLNHYMKYELKYGRSLERDIIPNSEFLDSCGNTDGYFSNISQGCYDYQTDEALFNYEDTERSCSSDDVTPRDEDEKMFEGSDSDDSYIHDSEEHPLPRGIHNPNYPGFQHLAYTLQDYPLESPNSYENSIFSNVDIINQNQFELSRLTHIKQSDSFGETNNNINIASSQEDNLENDDANYTEKESLENVTNLKRSEVIQIPNHPLKRRARIGYEEDDGEVANGDHSCTSQVSTDIFLYSECIDSKDCNQEVIARNNSEQDITYCKEAAPISNFEDDIIALQRDIYEEIQKPLASTIENISEVVNNVIKCYVDQQFAMEDDVLNQLSSAISSNHRIGLSGENILASENWNLDDDSTNKLKDLPDQINLNMDDAYMTNAKEELFQNQHRYLDSLALVDDALRSTCEESQLKMHTTDMNCNESNVDGNIVNVNHNKSSPPDNKDLLHNEMQDEAHFRNKYADNERTPLDCKIKIVAPSDGFDVYNIETAMPLIDLDAIENHLRAAREEERRRRNDREEIRRRLAMGAELDEFYTSGDRPGRKPSLHARLQSGMNLQICFMNETASDTESPSESELACDGRSLNENICDDINVKCKELSDTIVNPSSSFQSPEMPNNLKSKGVTRPSSLALNDAARPALISNPSTQAAFFECQARLQTEARMALAQAKEMARMQMEIERQKQENSPITEMLRCSLLKAGVQLTGDRRRVSRQMLTDMNVAQLQVIVNELHTQIEYLNESLVKLLIARDELHMGQDSMLVDIEDLTRHLSAKEVSSKSSDAHDESPSSVSFGKQNHLKSHLSSLTSLLTK